MQIDIEKWPFGFVFGVQLGLRQTQALIKTKTIRKGRVPRAILRLNRKLLRSCNIAGGTFLLLIFLSWSVPVSAEGRVEHQKLNQVAAQLPPGWVFGVQLNYSCLKNGKRWSGPRRSSSFDAYHIWCLPYLMLTIFEPSQFMDCLKFMNCFKNQKYHLRDTNPRPTDEWLF